MIFKTAILVGLVVLGSAKRHDLEDTKTDSVVDDILNFKDVKEWTRQEKDILADLVRLEKINRGFVQKFLSLNVRDRQIIGNLARDINKIIERGEELHQAKQDKPYGGVKGDFVDTNIEVLKKWVQTEIEKHILKNLYVLQNIDNQIVEDLLWLDSHQRKMIANLAHQINHFALRRGSTYPQKLWSYVMEINTH